LALPALAGRPHGDLVPCLTSDAPQASETQLVGAEFIDCRLAEPCAITMLAGRSAWPQVGIERRDGVRRRWTTPT